MIDEPQLARLTNGTLVMIGHGDAESAGRNTLAMAFSYDNGYSFRGLHKVAGLVQPGVGLGLVIKDDVIFVSHDNNGTLGNTAPIAHDASRNNLTVSQSADLGKTWVTRAVDRRFTGLSAMAEVSQPAAAGPAGPAQTLLGVMYEGGDDRFDGGGIWFATLPFEWNG